jgi:hypothetical protein
MKNKDLNRYGCHRLDPLNGKNCIMTLAGLRTRYQKYEEV